MNVSPKYKYCFTCEEKTEQLQLANLKEGNRYHLTFQSFYLQSYISFYIPIFQVDIAGTLNLMGLTINTVVSVPVILAVGIAIDYSVHICHAFLVLSGSRNGEHVCTFF